MRGGGEEEVILCCRSVAQGKKGAGRDGRCEKGCGKEDGNATRGGGGQDGCEGTGEACVGAWWEADGC
eukprot:765882-Hanusia_phi.AAC.2